MIIKPEYQEMLKEAASQKHKSEAIAKALKTHRDQISYESLKSCHEEAFSDIDCLSCANCCKTSPPLVKTQDMKRIAQHLKISLKQFMRKYVLEDVNGEMSFAQVPCVFLGDDNKCTIYDIRPEACRRYPHTDERDYFMRTSLNVKNTLICPAAYSILLKMEKILDTK